MPPNDDFKDMKLHMGLADLMGPAFHIHKIFADHRVLQDSLVPQSLHAITGMQRNIEQISDPLNLGLTRSLAGMHEHAALLDSVRAAIGVVSHHDHLLRASCATALISGLSAFPDTQGLWKQMNCFVDLDQALAGLVGHHAGWQNHLAQSILPSLALMAGEWDRRVGVLASTAHPELGASLSWPHDADLTDLAVAALLSESETADLPQIVIAINVKCSLCGEGLMKSNQSFRWKGPAEGLVEVLVVPLCPGCMRRSNEDPGYIEDALQRLTRPNLRIIECEGIGDSVRRGELRLVQDMAPDEPERDE